MGTSYQDYVLINTRFFLYLVQWFKHISRFCSMYIIYCENRACVILFYTPISLILYNILKYFYCLEISKESLNQHFLNLQLLLFLIVLGDSCDPEYNIMSFHNSSVLCLSWYFIEYFIFNIFKFRIITW